ncbi:MarR family winged helix-turn-helix transcriptional regulator [Vibrio aerogenes]|uniref:MarR family winged helix-turn-helix transcriptional regulator n=1 Tax=Vibrio aerogenes TaxID=92172 RepID=UPI000A0454F2
MEKHEELLVALRQIIRIFDLYSRQLTKEYGLTSPQLILMQSIRLSENQTIRELSHQTNMSQATATSILDRLENRGFVVRMRDQNDKRKVHAVLTDSGLAVLNKAPQLMPQDFINHFQSLESWEQNLILSSLKRVAAMTQQTESADTPESTNRSE